MANLDPTSGITPQQPSVPRSTMSGGANPPKNLGHNVSDMRFGDIPVKPTDAKDSGSRPNPNIQSPPVNGSPSHIQRQPYDNRLHRPNQQSPYAYSQNMAYQTRGSRPNQPFNPQGPPQGFYPGYSQQYGYYSGNVVSPAPIPYFTPGFNPVAFPQSPPPNVPFDVNQKGSVSPNHSSPIPNRIHPMQKTYTPIKLIDPTTHQPIDLSKNSTASGVGSASSTPSGSNASLAMGAPSSPYPTFGSPAPALSNASPIISSSNTSAASPISSHKRTGSTVQSTSTLDVKNQLKEQIKQKLEEEKRKKEEEEKLAKDAHQEKEKEKETLRLEEEKKASDEAARVAKEAQEAKEKEEQEAARLKQEKEAEELEQKKVKEAEELRIAEEAKKQQLTEAEKSEQLPDSVEVTKEVDSLPAEEDNLQTTEKRVAAALANVNDRLHKNISGAAVTTLSPTSSRSSSVSAPSVNPIKSLEKATRPSPEEIQKLTYPEGVHGSSINSTTDNKYFYDVDFLMQFQPVVEFPPKENWDAIRNVMNLDKGNFNSKTSFSRSFSRQGFGMQGHNQPAMGAFVSGQGGFRGFERQGSKSGGMGQGGIHMGKPLMRMSSSTNLSNSLGGNGPSKSGRQGSSRRKGGERSGSNRGDRQHSDNAGSDQSGPTIPVAPLVKSANAWAPRSSASTPAVDGPISETNRMPPDLVQRKVNSLLNKMTLENFDRISDQILDIAAQSKFEKDGRTLRQVIELTFAKAVDEAHWSNMYARFCAKTLSQMNPDIEDENIKDAKGALVKGGPLFRKYLLNRCQEEFERGWSDKLPTNADGTALDADLMSDDYYKAVTAKRRGLGLIRFVGELFMLDMLTEKIMHACITKLLGTSTNPSEELIESLCQLMTTVGGRLDSNQSLVRYMDIYFERMDAIQKNPKLPSRLRFMLMDVIDLRKNGWPKTKDKGPKTLSEIHDEARIKQAEDAAKSMSRNNSNRGGGGYGRSESKTNFNLAGDLSRLGRIRSQGPSGQTTLGPASMLNRDLSGNSSRKSSASSSPGVALSKDGSRNPSLSNQKANIFEHLNDEGEADKSESK